MTSAVMALDSTVKEIGGPCCPWKPVEVPTHFPVKLGGVGVGAGVGAGVAAGAAGVVGLPPPPHPVIPRIETRQTAMKAAAQTLFMTLLVRGIAARKDRGSV
jgi:hypothetical protein